MRLDYSSLLDTILEDHEEHGDHASDISDHHLHSEEEWAELRARLPQSLQELGDTLENRLNWTFETVGHPNEIIFYNTLDSYPVDWGSYGSKLVAIIWFKGNQPLVSVCYCPNPYRDEQLGRKLVAEKKRFNVGNANQALAYIDRLEKKCNATPQVRRW